MKSIKQIVTNTDHNSSSSSSSRNNNNYNNNTGEIEQTRKYQCALHAGRINSWDLFHIYVHGKHMCVFMSSGKIIYFSKNFLKSLLEDMLIDFREREREGGRGRERERNVAQLLPLYFLTRDGTSNLCMCPDWGSNRNLLVHRTQSKQLNHPARARKMYFVMWTTVKKVWRPLIEAMVAFPLEISH